MSNKSSLLISIAALLVSVISLYFSARSSEYTMRTFEREEKYSAVWTQSTLKLLRDPIQAPGRLRIPIVIENRSKYPTEIELIAKSEEMALGVDNGKADPNVWLFQLSFGRFVIMPNEPYTATLHLAPLGHNPQNAKVSFYTNGKLTHEVSYKYIPNIKQYITELKTHDTTAR